MSQQSQGPAANPAHSSSSGSSSLAVLTCRPRPNAVLWGRAASAPGGDTSPEHLTGHSYVINFSVNRSLTGFRLFPFRLCKLSSKNQGRALFNLCTALCRAVGLAKSLQESSSFNFSFVTAFVGRLCLNSLLSSPQGCWSGAARLCCPGTCPLPAAPVLALGTPCSCPCTNALSAEPPYSKWFCSELSGAAGAQGKVSWAQAALQIILPLPPSARLLAASILQHQQ